MGLAVSAIYQDLDILAMTVARHACMGWSNQKAKTSGFA